MSFARTCGAFAYAGFDRPGSWNGTRTSPSRPAGLAGRRSRCRRRPRTQEPGTLSTALIRPGIVPGQRPESRAVISCSSRPLPSGSPNERNEEQSTAAGFRACHVSLGPGAMHHPPASRNTPTPRSARSAWAVSMPKTAQVQALRAARRAEGGLAPKTEQDQAGGVNCTARKPRRRRGRRRAAAPAARRSPRLAPPRRPPPQPRVSRPPPCSCPGVVTWC